MVKFPTSELNDIEIVEGSLEELKAFYPRFQADFAADELKDYEHLEILVGKKRYKFLLAKHKLSNEIVGYAFIYEIAQLKALWLDYMAIVPEFRNGGYGSIFFNKIAEFKQEGILGLFLEVEIPEETEGPTRAEQQRRISFYERLGAEKLAINYELPTKNGGFPMNLFFRPTTTIQVLPKGKIKEAILSAFEYIHSDVSNREDILDKFLPSIGDEYLK
ncbi:GNAT family N-acetyltransferase [Neobacillus sp. FSL H8-0543]|uniref:GNAT family N-acetyltransferase n=1 Tax=Neobacillus sp. FSL H8-0543 TaxID=2954672 RepID=UPI003159410E